MLVAAAPQVNLHQNTTKNRTSQAKTTILILQAFWDQA
jgi:hypothetical protein